LTFGAVAHSYRVAGGPGADANIVGLGVGQVGEHGTTPACDTTPRPPD
jgi:hypothetical protein